MLSKVGVYLWAGPGTVRIIREKYFSPQIDHKSLSSSYDYEYLKKLQNTFGVTDAWVSCSWGFNEKTETQDYKFVLTKLKNFKKLKIKTHAYLQGTNLVYREFPNVDWWCKDERNRDITYYKGRKVTCVNNPGFRKYFFEKLKKLVKQDFDGIYIDNVQMGQLGIPMPSGQLPFVFAGCDCKHCQKKFKQIYNLNIPRDFEKNPNTTRKYLEFRAKSIEEFIKECSKLAGKKEFGTNSYDPKFNLVNLYGFDYKKLAKYQTYLLFENHALKNKSINNKYIDKIAKKLNKPIFVVSYKNGVGFEPQFTQNNFDLIFSESVISHFFPMIKGSEYTTNNIWHNLYLDKLSKPKINSKIQTKKKDGFSKTTKILQSKLVRKLCKGYYNPSYRLVMENRIARVFMKMAYELVLH